MRHSLFRSPAYVRTLFFAAVMGLGAARAAAEEGAKNPPAKIAAAYAIVATDRLRITVYQEEDLSVLARVDAKGAVNLPLAGEVYIAGKSVSEAQKVIEAAYRDGRFLRSPQVTINIEEYAAREASVQGMVRNPGRYSLPIEASMTVLELVTKAGGLTDTAKGTAITVTRITAEGKKMVFTVDIESLIKGKDRAKATDNSLILLPGDIVYVPERII
jgi:polysaccharide export outer membrane protein